MVAPAAFPGAFSRSPGTFPFPTPHDPGEALAPGRLVLLTGAPAALAHAESTLILKAVSESKPALIVCGDNRLDAYGLLARARRLGLEDALADGVILARAFTVHQFAALMEETLPRMAAQSLVPPGVALVQGLLEPYLDEDVPLPEARALLRRTLRTSRAWAATQPFPLVATCLPRADDHHAALMAIASEEAARTVEVMRPRDDARQRVLESYAEAL